MRYPSIFNYAAAIKDAASNLDITQIRCGIKMNEK